VSLAVLVGVLAAIAVISLYLAVRVFRSGA
jgi:hypothetical protein